MKQSNDGWWAPYENIMLFDNFIEHGTNWQAYDVFGRTPAKIKDHYYHIPRRRTLSELEQDIVRKAVMRFGADNRKRIAACVHLEPKLLDQYIANCSPAEDSCGSTHVDQQSVENMCNAIEIVPAPEVIDDIHQEISEENSRIVQSPIQWGDDFDPSQFIPQVVDVPADDCFSPTWIDSEETFSPFEDMTTTWLPDETEPLSFWPDDEFLTKDW
jgi:hypothetical protein